MGRGNVCVHGKYEGLYFIDRDYIDVYTAPSPDEEDCCLVKTLGDLSCAELQSGAWTFDKVAPDEAVYQVLEGFIEAFQKRFPSFERFEDETWKDDRRLLLENGLFIIALEDNEWALAMELLQKEDNYQNLEGLQSRQYQRYLEGMRDALLEQLPSIGTYEGPWTSGRLYRGETTKNVV